MDLSRSVSSKDKKNWDSNIPPISQENARSQTARTSEPSGSIPEASSGTGASRRNWRFGEVFEFRELRTATNNFNEESLIWKGRFWNVYKGQLAGLHEPVAVKRLKVDGAEGKRKFLLEVCILPHMEHPNLVKMIGYTANREWGLVVYEFMPRGSLKSHLHDVAPDKEALDWKTRLKIASDVAKGLSYLHQLKPNYVIYGDLKSSNILLDEEFHAKLSDAGLAKCRPEEDRLAASTTGRLSVESDVCNFGELLFELITGRPSSDPSDPSISQPNATKPDRIYEVADPRLKGEFPLRSLQLALELASKCVNKDARRRPSMEQVALDLDSLLRSKDT